MGDAIGVMQGEVERRTADQRGEGRDGDAFRQAGVKLLQDIRQRFLQEIVTNLHRMAAGAEIRISLGQRIAEIMQRLRTDIVGHRRRPDPLYAQRRLAPPFGTGAIGFLDRDAHAGADHACDRLMAELKWKT